MTNRMTRSWDDLPIRASGNLLDRPFAGSGWPRPKGIKLERNKTWGIGEGKSETGDRLAWSWSDEKGQYCELARHDTRALEGFFRIAEEPAKAIRRFADTWGVLGLCREGKPIGHPGCIGSSGRRPTFESLAAWREWSGRLRAATAIAAQLRNAQPGAAHDWRLLLPNENGRDWGSLADQRMRLARCVDEWLRCSEVRLGFYWIDERQFVFLRPGTLLGALLLQLLIAIGQYRGLAVCQSCLRAYLARRKPREDRDALCSKCGRKESGRRNARAYRARKRQQEIIAAVRRRACRRQSIGSCRAR